MQNIPFQIVDVGTSTKTTSETQQRFFSENLSFLQRRMIFTAGTLTDFDTCR